MIGNWGTGAGQCPKCNTLPAVMIHVLRDKGYAHLCSDQTNYGFHLYGSLNNNRCKT